MLHREWTLKGRKHGLACGRASSVQLGERTKSILKRTAKLCLSGPHRLLVHRDVWFQVRDGNTIGRFLLKGFLKDVSCVCTVWIHMPQHPCAGQKTTLEAVPAFSPYLGSSGYGCSTFSHRASLLPLMRISPSVLCHPGPGRSTKPGQVATCQGQAPPRAFVFLQKRQGRVG